MSPSSHQENRPDLSTADWMQSPALQRIFQLFDHDAGVIRIVGGAARDHLLGLAVKDIDLATTLLPEQVIARAKAAGLTALPTGIEHGTVTLLAEGTAFEITTLREDVETDGRHALVRFGTDWLEDAKRRDFTINALYISPDGQIHDPLGTALEDLRERRLRFIGAAETRLKEDHLRALRFYRFAALYANPPFDQAAITATMRQRAGLRQLSGERVGNEIMKLLMAEDPRPALRIMYQTGLLSAILATVPNITLLNNLVESYEGMPDMEEAALRLGALAIWPGSDPAVLAERLRLSKKQQAGLRLVAAHAAFPSPDDHTALQFAHYKNGPAIFNAHIRLALAAARDAGETAAWRARQQQFDGVTYPPFPLRGEDIIKAGIAPGPAVGEALFKLEKSWLEAGQKLTKAELLAKLG